MEKQIFWYGDKVFALPLYHPVRLGAAFVAYAYVPVVPVLYLAIYRFRHKHDRDVTGS